MSRYRSAGSYNQAVQRIGRDHWRLYWTVDRYYSNSRLRHPRVSWRDTDLAGAVRFAKRWELPIPQEADDAQG